MKQIDELDTVMNVDNFSDFSDCIVTDVFSTFQM